MNELLPFQKNTVKRMLNIESENCIEYMSQDFYKYVKEYYSFGLLTNKAGSGKTRCIIELCKYQCTTLYYNQKIITWNMPFDWQKYKLPPNSIECPNTNIICVQYSMFSHWKEAIEAQFDSSQVLYVQSKESLAGIHTLFNNYYNYHSSNIDSISSLFETASLASIVEMPKIILVKNTLYQQFYNSIVQFSVIFDRIIFDDYTHISITKSDIIGKFTWFVSGATKDVYSLDHLNLFKHIRSSISKQLYTHINVCLPSDNINKHLMSINLHVLRYKFPSHFTAITNSNIESILKPKAYIEGIFTLKSKMLHGKLIESMSKRMLLESNEDDKRYINSTINNLIERYNDPNCIVCLCSISYHFCLFKCCHKRICIDCLYSCIKSKIFNCPACRTPLILTINYYIYECIPTCSYVDRVANIVNQLQTKSHILIYFDEYKYDNLDKIIRDKCQIQIKPLIKGNENAVTYNMNEFNSGKLNALVINKLDVYFGYDLKYTKHLIIIKNSNIYTPINSIIGKCQRISRDSPLTVYIVTNAIIDLSSIDYAHNFPK